MLPPQDDLDHTPGHGMHPEQTAEGVDLSLIRDNLGRTPRERLRRGEAARQSALRLRRHARRIR